MRKVQDMHINANTTLAELLENYEKAGGFVAKKVAIASEILSEIFGKAEIRILSFPACIIATGTRGIIADALRKKLFNIVITTCGTLDHDFARAYRNYFHGSFDADDRELSKRGIHRLGNVFIPTSNYGEIIERKLQPMLKEIYASGKRELATYELVWEIGKRIKDKSSILYWSYKNKIPVIVPGITDGAFGTQLFLFMQQHRDFSINVFKDEELLAEKLFGNVASGALIIGGGISKHHTIWWNQFKGGLEYAVYITTAPEWDGSLSGARTREAISWSKIKKRAKHITVEGDATVLLPLVLGNFL